MGTRFEVLRRAKGTNPIWWRYGASGLAAWSYLAGSGAVSAETSDVVDQVRRRGVGVTHVDRLFAPGDDAFARLVDHVSELSALRAAEIDAARMTNGEVRQVSLTGAHPALRPSDPVVAFLTAPALRETADLFYRMPARLLEAKVWQTVAGERSPTKTQRWHRDRPGDLHLLKCFVYLNDVTDDCGPFSFAPGTQRGGGVEPSRAAVLDGKVDRFEDRDVDTGLETVSCAGPAGTVVFADTTGLHMGGRSRLGERLMVTAHYGSAAAWQRPYFSVVERSTDRTTGYALGTARPPRARHLRHRRFNPEGSPS